MRFFAPLSVFIFGISALLNRYFCTRRCDFLNRYCFRTFGALRFGLLLRTEHHDHVAPIQFGRGLHLGHILELLDNSIENLLTQLRVSRLATAEHDGDLDLVTFAQELLHEARLGVEVARTNFRAVLHLLDAYVESLTTRLLGFLGLVEFELAVIHDPTNRWLRGRRNLHEVQIEAFCQRQRVSCGHYSPLITVLVDQA